MDGKPRVPRKIVVFPRGCCPDEATLLSCGVRPLRWLPLVNGMVVDMPEAATLAAAVLKEVERVDDHLVLRAVEGAAAPDGEEPESAGGGGEPQRGCLPTLLARLGLPRCRREGKPGQVVPWGVRYVRAPAAWAATRGQGVRVAFLDTGVDLRHPDLQARLASGYNALRPGRDLQDDNGHGTHVAGIVGANDDGRGVVGVAPECRLYAVKVLDAYGAGMLSDLVDGLEWCLRERVQLVNMSLGTDRSNATFAEAIRRAYEGGLVLVAAAGNSGPGQDTVQYPARYAEIICVSAFNASGRMPDCASRGPAVDVLAPGEGVPSTWPGGWRTLSGTSMAAPHVAGAVALLLVLRTSLPPTEVKAASAAAGARCPVTAGAPSTPQPSCLRRSPSARGTFQPPERLAGHPAQAWAGPAEPVSPARTSRWPRGRLLRCPRSGRRPAAVRPRRPGSW